MLREGHQAINIPWRYQYVLVFSSIPRRLRSPGWSIAPSFGRSVLRPVGRSVCLPVGRSVGRSVGRLVGRCFGRSTARSFEPSVRSVARRSACRTAARSVIRSTSSLENSFAALGHLRPSRCRSVDRAFGLESERF